MSRASPNASRRSRPVWLNRNWPGLCAPVRASPKRYLVVALKVTVEDPQL